MKKKVLLLLILCLVLPFIVTIVTYSANPDVTFTLSRMNAQRGTSIIVKIDMNCVNSFNAANLVLNYDSNVLEYVPYYYQGEVDYTDNIGSAISTNSPTLAINSGTAGTLKIGYISQKAVSGSGEFLKFKFNVKSNASYGDSNLTLSSTTLKNSSGNDLTPNCVDGKVSILSGITMNNTTLSMEVGNSSQLSVSSSNGTIFDNVTWTSNNSSVVKVTANTNSTTASIQALAVGSARVDASVGGVTASCTITVTEPEQTYDIEISKDDWSFLPPTQKRPLTATFSPASAGTGKTITWSSLNPSVATVDSSTGIVTAVANGTATITASDGTITKTQSITVSHTLGDVDNDSKITSYDAYKALVLFGNQGTNQDFSHDEAAILDVDRNGTMTPNDTYLILKHSVGLINSFPN